LSEHSLTPWHLRATIILLVMGPCGSGGRVCNSQKLTPVSPVTKFITVQDEKRSSVLAGEVAKESVLGAGDKWKKPRSVCVDRSKRISHHSFPLPKGWRCGVEANSA
jgi:hypothetical protein